MKAKVYITPRKGVLDPQGVAVNKSLHTIGFTNVADVKIGKFVEILLDDNKSLKEVGETVDNMCKKLLVNEVIEEYRFEISK